MSAAAAILTPARIQTLAKFPHLQHTWHFIAAATLSVCNEPGEIPRLYTHVLNSLTPTATTAATTTTESANSDRLHVTQQFREALLKAAALAGLPRTINSLTQLKNVTPQELRETRVLRPVHTPPPVAGAPAEVGADFFSKVYGKITKRVLGQLSTAYPDLGWYTIDHVYDPLLSFTGVLSAKETSLVVIACLIPQDVNPQLKGHLKGALNNGATPEEVGSAREMAILISEWCGIKWKNPVAKL
ncbi:hypothetical protein D0Z00_002365 [Geotrichum galactomycetum]|uniref:Uncharacterized protein n=1 Tax=Geotrichum galactomycetum TaxID=27317 RepID=A0ACB6V4D9_9ASCO|nr:hypothetical protein D0Z00_002365 [Geotrichum candidum]